MEKIAKRGHKELSLEDKKIIKASEAIPKPRQGDLKKQLGIGRSSVSDILQKCSWYLKAWESNHTAGQTTVNCKDHSNKFAE